MGSLVFEDDLPLVEAVSQARNAAPQGREDAWDALDRFLRWHLLEHLQNRSGQPEELLEALLKASHWARREEKIPWCFRWPYLLEILEDANHQPGLATDLEALAEGRAAELLSLLLQEGKPMRPGDLAERMGLLKQQISNLGLKLEKAGLIVRRSGQGRAAWFYAAPRAEQIAARLPGTVSTSPHTEASAQDTSAEEDFWVGEALGQPVSLAAAG